jgi:hypothetical protein
VLLFEIMHLYSVYIDNEEATSPMIIKQGFSFLALVFNFFWALYHKMWFVAAVVVLMNLIVMQFASLTLVWQVIQLFVFGFFASEIREFYAIGRGMKLDDVILAGSNEEAEVKYMMRVVS